LIDTHDLVGFFWASEIDHLIDTVDECTDPGMCEYAELPVGGIMWTAPARPVPLDPGETDNDEAEPVPWSGAELSELWSGVVYGFDKPEWTRFFPEEPRDPPRPSSRHASKTPGMIIPLGRRGKPDTAGGS